MEFRSRFDTLRRPRWLAALASVLLLLGTVGTSAGEPPKDRPDRGGGLTPATTPNLIQYQRNRVILLLPDNGEIGSSGSSVAGGGFWIVTTDQYIFSSGPNIGATIPGAGDTVVAIGGPFSELEAGGPILDGLVLDEFYSTANPEDVGNFPEACTVDDFRVSQFPALQPFAGEPFPGFADETVCIGSNDLQTGTCADCGGTRVGVEIVTTTFAFGVPSVQDFVFVAFRVFNRTEFITAENTPAVAAGTVPPGPYDLENTIVAIAIDPDVGEAGDDQIAFLPEVQTMIWWDSDFTEPQFQNPLGFGGVTYLKTPTDPNTGEEVGLQEFTVFTNGNPRPDPSDKETWYQLMTGDISEVVLEVDPRDVRGMASSGRFTLPQGEFVEVYAAYFFAGTSGAPPSQLLAEAYKNLQTGELNPNANTAPVFDNFKTVQLTAQATFDAGFVVPTAPPKPDFELIPGDMQVTIVWETDPLETVNPFAKVARDPFARLPSGAPDPEAPPALDIDGNIQILEAEDVIFDASRDTGGITGFVTAATAGFVGDTVTNAAFNLNFVIQDFQGFRVYRSRGGSTIDAELIAQFDLQDGVVSGLFCSAAQAVFLGEEFVDTVCTATVDANLGTDTGLTFAVVDRGGSFPNPAAGPGLINGIPVFYTVTSFAVNPGQTPVQLPSSEAFADLNASATPALPLVLESGLAPLEQTTPRSNSSAFTGAPTSPAQLLSGAGEVLNPSGDIPLDADGNLVGPIPPANGFAATFDVVDAELIPEDFQARIRVDSMPVAYEFFGGDFWPTVFGIDAADADGSYTNLPGGDARGRRIFFTMTDGDGNVLQTATGPATGFLDTGFIPFDGTATVGSQVFSILSPEDPNAGVAFNISFSFTFGERNDQCSRTGTCLVLTGEGGSVPGSIAVADFEVGAYGQLTYRDIELVWSNQGGQLSLSRVHDLTHDVAIPFSSTYGQEAWGFAAPSGAGPEEEALANDFAFVEANVPRTADGRFLYGDPLWTAVGGQNFSFGGGLPQAGPDWTDFPVVPDIFSLLEPHSATFTAPFRAEGVLSETATLYTCPASDGAFACSDAGAGQQGTRLWIANQWLDVSFASLPVEGETWLIKLGSGQADTPRVPPPGTAIAFDVQGGTNELANADLSAIRVVPNPFIAANEITRGNGLQRILFTNLPPQATIRIYTISGNLVRVLEHTDGSGTEPWDVRTRFDLVVASGNYYFHVTTPDGRTHLGRFAVVN